MNYTGSLDTNIILRFLIGDITRQRTLATKLISSSDKQLLVADIAIIEVVFVLSRQYEVSRQQIADMIRVFMNLGSINCNRDLFDEALKLFVKFPAQSFEDCCLTIYARQNEAEPLHTFDRKLASQIAGVKLLTNE